jgi:pilus assembly protein Flp/PilA
MKNLMSNLKHFVQDEEGVTAIEYGLIAASIAVVIILSVQAVGAGVDATFGSVAGAL